MSRPTLAVLMPNYNHARFLPQAIEAVATQSRPPDEFVIVDDASTDNSVEVIEAYARQHDFIRLIRHEANRGVVAGTETLQANSTADWLLFASADDYMLPGFFESAMALAEEHPQAGIIFGQVTLVPEGDEERVIETREVKRWQEPLYASPERFLRDFLQQTPTWYSLTHSTLYRREALREMGGFHREVGHLSDTVALRAVGLRHGAGYVPQPCVTWRVTPGSFAAREGWDAEAMLRITSELGTLLRSLEYRDLFPEEYTRRWERDLQAMTLEHFIWKLREPLGSSPWGMVRGRTLKRLLRLQVALQYRGDVAAFIHAHQRG